MSAAPPVEISYGTRPSRTRRWARRLRWPAVLALVGVTAFWWGPPAWRRVQHRYWFERCASHTAPADRVVWQIWDGPPGRVRGEKPYLPREWAEFYARSSPPGPKAHGNVFLGERRTPSGRRLLVAVDSLPDPVTWYHQASRNPKLLVRAFTPGAFPALPKQVIDAKTTVKLPGRGMASLFAGQRDPNDPTHFVIPYGGGELHRWVREDRIDIEPEAPAATTQPLPASAGRSPEPARPVE